LRRNGGLGCIRVYEVGEFRLDLRRRKLLRSGGEAVPLSGKSFDALAYLVQHAGRLVSRAELTKALWPNTVVEDNNLNVAISTLRRALGDEAPGQRYVVTVAGRGYQLVADVREVARDSDERGGEPPPRTASAATLPAPPPQPAASRSVNARWRRTAVATASLVAVAAVIAVTRGWRSEINETAGAVDTVQRVSSVTPYPGNEWFPSLSPDGDHVAFSWDGGSGNEDIFVKRLGAQDPLRLTTDAAADVGPAWSPDGSQIAFFRKRDLLHGDIYVVPALGGPERKVLEVSSNFMIAGQLAPLLAWTPDGKQVVFTGQTDDSGDIATGFDFYLVSLETGAVRALPIAGDGFDVGAALSADGRRLAFTRYDAVMRDGELMVQDLDAGFVPRGAPVLVPDSSLQYPGFPVWSPDGARLVFVRASQMLEWIVGGDTRPLYAATGQLGGLSIVWRSGEQPVAVAARSESDFDIWMVPLDPVTHTAVGPPTKRIGSSGRDEHPRFSPDGRLLAFVSWRGGGGDLWLADADGGRQRQISRLGASDPGTPRWSPDGSRISFTSFTPNGEPHVYLVDADEGVPRLVTTGTVSGWSRDGQWLYVTQLDGAPSIYRLRLADGHREELLPAGVAAQPSTDGTRIFYMHRAEPGIFARSLEGDVATNPEERLVDDYQRPPSGGFEPLDDGIVYVGFSTDGRARALRFYDFATGRGRDIVALPTEAAVVWGIAVSPDGRELLYTLPTSGVDLIRLEF
jgi:Tol biopolymer transport system component/DNA-binding winged helix-turn-helix (wHTH) protein